MEAKRTKAHVAVFFVVALHHAQKHERDWRHGPQRSKSHDQISGGADLDRPVPPGLKKVRARDFRREWPVFRAAENGISYGGEQTTSAIELSGLREFLTPAEPLERPEDLNRDCGGGRAAENGREHTRTLLRERVG
jgi:hypothetical protein